jgi:hypothetical protein
VSLKAASNHPPRNEFSGTSFARPVLWSEKHPLFENVAMARFSVVELAGVPGSGGVIGSLATSVTGLQAESADPAQPADV